MVIGYVWKFLKNVLFWLWKCLKIFWISHCIFCSDVFPSHVLTAFIIQNIYKRWINQWFMLCRSEADVRELIWWWKHINCYGKFSFLTKNLLYLVCFAISVAVQWNDFKIILCSSLHFHCTKIFLRKLWRPWLIFSRISPCSL